MSTITINAEARTDSGKGSSRRLRRLAGLIPGVVYGAGKESQSLTLIHKDLHKQVQDESVFSSTLTLNVAGKEELVVIKDLQRHPAKDILMHVDFLRVDANAALKVNVPLHFINEEACVGVKTQGGRITHTATTVEVSCLPGLLPEFIEIDMTDVEAGSSVHLSDIKFAEGITSVALALGADHDASIATVVVSKGKDDEDEDGAAAEEAPAEA
ncbi:large subunit ribosomal protein L25 [Sinobacterium caligoides]|uniref:Large ribosomal subunit protein bL25 n=1 Tax=Sinobacterium caligoides TaxID=933926 RepID=A0A3N2E0Z6_9GAMM|nr:50S ribosomal protein L25/general stress protein Ctc [Sinobacterium caligoides]ROS05780.1 large subunit ribosomal protein L25 [Sinobacterium caligoides]